MSDEEMIEQTFSVPTPARLELGNIRGTVQIEAGPQGEVAVRAVKHTGTGNGEHTEVSMTQAQDGSVKVETRYPGETTLSPLSWFFFRKPCKVDYVVRVPRQCSVKVSGVSNSASLGGLEGDFRVSTVSGPVTLSDLAGPLKVSAVSGNVRGEGCSGPLVFETVSGAVHFERGSLPSIDGSTVSGNISLDSALGEGPYRFNSVSGQVHWRLPGESACTVEVSSLSGGLRTSLPKTRIRSNRQHGPGGSELAELNGGGVRVAHHSVSGHLILGERSSPAQSGAPAEPVAEGRPVSKEPPPLSKMEILKRIELGELTVEEGLALIR